MVSPKLVGICMDKDIFSLLGGFQLEFVTSKSWVINLSALIGGKFILKNPLQDLLSSINAVISTNERN